MLIMALFYIVFIVVHKFFDEDDKANKISSIVAVIGLINIPIIKYSVEWWSTLHQPASIKITGTSTIHSSMLMPLMLMFFVLILYCALIFLMKYKTEIIRIKKKNLKRYDYQSNNNERVRNFRMVIFFNNFFSLWTCLLQDKKNTKKIREGICQRN